MLCPEVWNFAIPKNNISFESGSFDIKSEKKVKNLVDKHYFNDMVTIILPEEFSISTEIINFIKSSDYYIVRQLNLRDILRRDFVEAFIKRGNLTGISNDVQNELEDVFALTPEGSLILSINKDLYQSIGLEGRPIECSTKKKEKYSIRFIIKVDI